MRRLLALVAALVAVLAAATTTVSAATSTYDAPAVVRVDAKNSTVVAGELLQQVTASGEWSAAGSATSQGAFATLVLASVATEAAETSIYRGVATDHHAYDDALRGIARPGDVNGVSDVALHNAGFTHGTDLTSWSTQLSTAEGFAGNGGVVLETTIEALQRGGVQMLSSPDAFNEAEVLVKGLVGGLKVR